MSTVPPEPYLWTPEALTYDRTTTYHWPNFNENATDIEGEWTNSEGIGTGPFGFGSDVKLTDTSCMRDDDFIHATDECGKNPINCTDGLSFSIWEKMSYDTNVLVDRDIKIQSRKYVVSSGADYDPLTGIAYPGFAIYHEGPELVAVVSTGEEVWELSVTGIIQNETWVNIGVTWNKPDLADTETPLEKLGGLEMYINQEKVGSTLLPEFTDAGSPTFTAVKDYQIGDDDPPVVMIGCHYDYDNEAFGGFSGAEYDELAMWTRKLGTNATHDETEFFLGGLELEKAEVNADQLQVLLGGADLDDPVQAEMANQVVAAMLLPPPKAKSVLPTRPPNKTDTVKTTTEAGATTATPEEGAANDIALDQLSLQEVMTTMLNVDSVEGIRDPETVEMRFPLSIVAAKLLSGADKENVAKWDAVHKNYPKEEAAPKTLRQLMKYMMTWVGSTNTSSPDKGNTNYYDPEAGTMNYTTSGEDFVMNAMKMPVGEYRKGPRISLPNYEGLEWQVNNEAWGLPRDTFSMPTGMFKDQPGCNDSDVTFTFAIFNKMGRAFPRRRNMGLVRHLDWAVDCRIFTSDVAANVNPLDATKENIEAAGQCLPDPEFMRENTIKYTCEHFLPEQARLVRRPLATTTWFSDADRGGVEVRHCVWWNDQFGMSGAWDPNGCNLIETDAFTTSCECENFGASTVLLEQAQIIQHEDDCELETLIKYIGIAVSTILLLIFVLGTACGRGVWDMFHSMGIHTSFTWIAAIGLHVVSDLESVRDGRNSNLFVGLAMKYFYSASATWTMLEAHANFKAITAGIISGRTKIYHPFAYGTPLIPLGVLFLAFADDLGLDPRCFAGWNWYAKMSYLVWNLCVTTYGAVLAIVIIFNLTHPQTRRKNVVRALTSQARGVVILALAMFLFWIFATVTYLHNPESDLRDPYCIFILCLGWIGVLFFVCLGPCSKRWRYGIFGKKDEVYKVTEDDDNTVSVDESDMTDTMSVTSKGTALEASRPATAVSVAGSRPATAATADGSRPTTAKSNIDDDDMEDDDIGAVDDGDENVTEDDEIADVV